MNPARAFLNDDRGASAFEFVLVVPILALFIFGALDAGFFAWRINLAEKATQAGARRAVVTDPVEGGIASEKYVGKTVSGTVLQQGDVIPAAALGLIQCTSTACTCVTTPCVTTSSFNSTPFNAIVTRMQIYDPTVQAANVLVEYRGSGLGFAGDPGGMQIAPMVTVRLTGMTYTPLSGFLFRSNIALPDFAYSLTMEDGSGSKSN